MRLRLSSTALCLVSALLTFDTSLAAQVTGQPPTGAREFQQKCGVCHIDGRIGPPLSKLNIEDREADLRTRVLEGGVRMPAFKYMLSSEDVDLIFGYLKTLDAPPTLIGSAGGTP